MLPPKRSSRQAEGRDRPCAQGGDDTPLVRPAGLPDDAILRVIRVPPELAGTRLDRFLQRELRNTSRSRSQQIIARGAYRVDGRPLRKSQRLGAEERVVLWREPLDEGPVDSSLTILYQDAELLAVDKPPMVTVHPTARVHHSTVIMLLTRQLAGERPRLLHRLDRETSGVLLLARTPEADRRVKAQFEARERIVKRYLALAWGAADWREHRCELPLEPDVDCGLRVKMRIAVTPAPDAAAQEPPESSELLGRARSPGAGSSGAGSTRAASAGAAAWPRASWVGEPHAWTAETRAGRVLPAATTFELVGRRRNRETGRAYSLLRCTLHTGRQHQIRVHLASLGLPVVGDKLYGPDETIVARAADGALTDDDRQRLELPRHALHAESIELDHPMTGERLRIVAPIPPDLRAFWDALEAGVST